jgi:hypothetical protein
MPDAFEDLLDSFLTQRWAHSRLYDGTKEDILRGVAWHRQKPFVIDGEPVPEFRGPEGYHFRLKDLLAFLRARNFHMPSSEVTARIKALSPADAETLVLMRVGGKVLNLWVVPESFVVGHLPSSHDARHATRRPTAIRRAT